MCAARRGCSPRRGSGAAAGRAATTTITTERPDADATACLTTREGNATVFIAVDHCTQECVGTMRLVPARASRRWSRCARGCGSTPGTNLRHDHGSQYLSDHFQGELSFLGIRSSPSFVAAPEGNGCAERFIRTLKEQLLWVETFETVEQLRLALLAFKDRYNQALRWRLLCSYASPALDPGCGCGGTCGLAFPNPQRPPNRNANHPGPINQCLGRRRVLLNRS